jgi:hypothetical protein
METTAGRNTRPFTLTDAVAVLTRTPATLDALLRGLPEAWTSTNEGGESWSARDVIGHLIHGERTNWMARVRIVLAHGESQPFDKFDRFAQFSQSPGKPMPELLDEFAAVRAGNLRELEALKLAPADLDRRGTHPSLGPLTLRNLLATWVAHDFDHTIQIARVMARQYSDAVGPFREYLRVINGAPI